MLNQLKVADGLTGCGLHWLKEADSTNTVAKRLARNGIGLPVLIVAESQTQGRGQHGRSWWSDEGSLTFSLAIAIERELKISLLPLVAANAVCDSLANVGQVVPKIKWPNDIYINDRKVAGMLVETIQNRVSDIAVIGIGINVNCRIAKAPKMLQNKLTSIFAETGGEVDLNDLLLHVTATLKDAVEEFSLGANTVVEKGLKRSLFTQGSVLTIETRQGQRITGNFSGIDANGRLLVDEKGERIVLESATIIDYEISP